MNNKHAVAAFVQAITCMFEEECDQDTEPNHASLQGAAPTQPLWWACAVRFCRG